MTKPHQSTGQCDRCGGSGDEPGCMYGYEEACRKCGGALHAAAPPFFEAWQPIATAPRDDTPCLFFAPANPQAGNENARRLRMLVDAFSDEWPRARYQYPEAPYTHWMPLPEAPK